MITVRHRAIHENQSYTVWQSKGPGIPTRYAATFDADKESIKPTVFPNETLFGAVDAMVGQTVSEPAITAATDSTHQLTLWN